MKDIIEGIGGYWNFDETFSSRDMCNVINQETKSIEEFREINHRQRTMELCAPIDRWIVRRNGYR